MTTHMTNYYPDQESDTMLDKLDVVVRMMDACSALNTAARHSALEPDTHGYDIGKKYAKVWAQTWTRNIVCDECREAMVWDTPCLHAKRVVENQKFVCFFVDLTTGDVWKADGWKKPTLNFVRGNITTPQGRYAITGGKLSDSGYFYGGF